MTDAALIGRDRELYALTAQVRRPGGSGSVLVVLGEPGIGKTSLLRATRSTARSSGCRVLSSVGVEAEAALPFAGLHQILGPILSDVDRLSATHREALLVAFGMAEGPRPDLFLIAEAALRLVAARRGRSGSSFSPTTSNGWTRPPRKSWPSSGTGSRRCRSA